MITPKNLLVLVIALLLMSSLVACAPGGVMMPDRDVSISVEEAVAGQNALMAGLSTGSVELTESQFSSLITVLLQQSGDQVPIQSVTAMFDPGKMYLSLELDQAATGLDSLVLSGNVMVEDYMVKVDLDEAAVGPLAADAGLVDFIGQRITAALNDPQLGTIVGVSIGEGTLALSVSP